MIIALPDTSYTFFPSPVTEPKSDVLLVLGGCGSDYYPDAYGQCAIKSADIPGPTANRILREVRDKGLLKEIRAPSGRRAAILAFSGLLNIAEGRVAF